MLHYTLVIGNKNFSSWSLRAWLAMRATSAPFTEIRIPLRTEQSRTLILSHSPSGKVPALKYGPHVVWDSLAIGETLAETFPDAGLWPADACARAHARALCAEMHSGFEPLRSQHPMDMTARTPKPPSAEVRANVDRIEHLWQEALGFLGRGEGDFLYGSFGLADAFYAPVVSRLVTYAIPVTDRSRRYMDAVWNHPYFQEWYAGAEQEVKNPRA